MTVGHWQLVAIHFFISFQNSKTRFPISFLLCTGTCQDRIPPFFNVKIFWHTIKNMTVQAPYLQIKGHQIDLNTHTNRLYSDEFKHVITYYYKAAHSDARYNNIRKTVAGKRFLKAVFELDVVPNWTIFGGTFVIVSNQEAFPISNSRAIELLTQQFLHQKHISNWIGIGYGFLRKVIYVQSHSDFRSNLIGSNEMNPKTPICPPTLYVSNGYKE